MLPVAIVQEIKRLLDAGELSQRKIAKQLEVSRGVVAAIAAGKRGLHGRETKSDEQQPPLGPPSRCPACGCLVYLPCISCRAEAYRKRSREDRQRQNHLPTRPADRRDRQSR